MIADKFKSRITVIWRKNHELAKTENKEKLIEKYQLMILSIIRRHERTILKIRRNNILLDTFGLYVFSEVSSKIWGRNKNRMFRCYYTCTLH